jgi:protein tyrosine/serine phosphatase
MTTLLWEGCGNVRDLGGLETADGATTRSGAIVRADNIRRLTDAGWEALVDHGVRTVVDLRFDEELAEDPPADLPVTVVHVSLFGHWTAEFEQEVRHEQRTTQDWAAMLRWLYLDALDRNAPAFAAAVMAVAGAGEGAVCIHCLAGKDRTGILAALLLRLAGVRLETVDADYAASERNVRRMFAAWIEEAADAEERAKRERHVHVPAGVMRDVLAELESRHGSVAEYLLQAGATQEDLDAVRRRLREER